MSLPLLFTGWSYNNNVLGGTRWRVSRLLWPKQEGGRNSLFNCYTHEVTQEEVARVVSPDTGLPCWRLCLPEEPLQHGLHILRLSFFLRCCPWAQPTEVCPVATISPKGQGKQNRSRLPGAVGMALVAALIPNSIWDLARTNCGDRFYSSV